MISRPTGAAHISITWFIVMVILFIGGVGFGYIQMQNNTKLLKEKEAAIKSEAKQKVETAKFSEQVGQISSPVGFLGADAATNPSEVEAKVKELKEVVGAAGSVKTIEEVLPLLTAMLSAQKNRITELESQVQGANTDRDSAISARRNVVSEKDREISQLTRARQDVESNLREQISNKDQVASQLRDKIRANNDKREQALAKWESERKKMDSELTKLQIRIERQKGKLDVISDPDSLDGKILVASPKLSAAWINLGRKQMVKPGMQFEVLELRGNDYVHKAWARVVSVKDEASEVVISGLVDQYNPVTKGDVIKNKLYDAKIKFNFVLLGRFADPFTKGEITRILMDMGNNVDNKVSSDTDYLLVGRELVGTNVTPIEQTEDFGLAQKYGVNILRLKDIRSFLKLY